MIDILSEHAELSLLSGRYSFLDYPGYLKCAFARNPWDRILSCYLNKVRKDPDYNNEVFVNGVMKKFQRFDVFYAGMPFDEFLTAVGDIPDENADGHFASQHPRLLMDGEIVVDFLGRFENYREDVVKLLQMVDIHKEVKFPHINRSRNRNPYPDYYNDSTREMVVHRYGKDIELFGYAYDDYQRWQ